MSGTALCFFIGPYPVVRPDPDAGNSAVHKIDKTHGVDMQMKETSGISKYELVRKC